MALRLPRRSKSKSRVQDTLQHLPGKDGNGHRPHLPDNLGKGAKRKVSVPKRSKGVSPWKVAGIGVGAATALGAVAWWALAGSKSRQQNPERHAAETGASVANAARAHVIDELESAASPGPDTLERAAREAVQEAASAGADVVAAALGAVEGSEIARESLSMDPAQARRLAAEGAMQAAHGTGAAAATRVREALRRDLEGGAASVASREA